MNAPRATLRMQLHKAFTFDHARAQVPYLKALGISHLYCSPILKARAGSMHGYDVVDPTTVNPELGGEDGLRQLVQALRDAQMGLIVDIVPNHMAVGGADNPWWLDVLEWGRDSRYAGHFDIDWDVLDRALTGRVLAPFLGKPYGAALADGEIMLAFDPHSGALYASYFEHRFPLAPAHYAPLLRSALRESAQALADALRTPGRARRRERFLHVRSELAVAARDPGIAHAINVALAPYNDDNGRRRLHRLLERQHYRLAWWRAAADEINWRRFFDVIDLAGLRIQHPQVFDDMHATLLRLYADGLIDGVRVDHVDGLADPRAYCRKLRARLDALTAQRPTSAPRSPPYIVVEKILAPGELLALDWKVQGTSGYAFMNEVGALLHDPRGETPLRTTWHEQTGNADTFEHEQKRARLRIPRELFTADFNACAHALHVIARSQPQTRDWTLDAIRRVLAELLVHFPVYRTYADGRGRSAADAAIMAVVVAHAKTTCRAGERALVDLVDSWLGGEAPLRAGGSVARRRRLRALARFQQLTSPVAAKSVEDTAFYRHATLLSRNEVGTDPAQFSLSVADFHAACVSRLRRHPHAMLATATHDHKRGEDLRARLAVVSEHPQMWSGQVRQWSAHHATLKTHNAPDATDEYFIYQMVVGAWPLTLRPDDVDGLAQLCERLSAWQEKAVREAKRRSGWVEPNLAYESGCREFLRRLLDPQSGAAFLAQAWALVEHIAAAGVVNGLTQTLLKLTTPGVPDIYQGCEFWDFSLVDPDNRRPVDYALRRCALEATDETLLDQWRDGRIKQRLIARTLALRAEHPALFAEGGYHPLRACGPAADDVVAYTREYEGRSALVAAIRLPGALLDGAASPLPAAAHWQDAWLALPKRLQQVQWRNQFSGTAMVASPRLALNDLFAKWPVALLRAD